MIRAVFYPIANLILRNATAGLAFELIQRAIAELLVLSVGTLADPIAMPRQRYAPFLRWAEVLVVSATLGTVIFVPMIFAIGSSVALPDAGNTSSWNEKFISLVTQYRGNTSLHVVTFLSHFCFSRFFDRVVPEIVAPSSTYRLSLDRIERSILHPVQRRTNQRAT